MLYPLRARRSRGGIGFRLVTAAGETAVNVAGQPFFVVWHGRETGLFYKWADCMRSVANVAKAKFKGFATLAEAEEAWETKGDAKR